MNKIDNHHDVMKQIVNNVETVIIGKRDEIYYTLVALLSNGHLLLEDVPGVGKTMLIRALAKTINSEYKRIQFTPDLLPSDVLGVSIYNQKTQEFEYRPGPIMANVVLADEVNRTSPKTQSALLEAMEESHVTVDGVTYALPKPFFVMATQNPIEYEGTFPLPEAQLDRFMLKMNMGYPKPEEELKMLEKLQSTIGHPIDQLQPVIQIEQLVELQQKASEIYVDESIQQYIVNIMEATRENSSIYLGASPRGSIALLKAAKAFAFIRGRSFVVPDDVKKMVNPTLSHRIILKADARLSGLTVNQVLDRILKEVVVPIEKSKEK